MVFNFYILNNVFLVIICLVVPVLSNMITITEETLVCTEMYISTILLTLLLTHRLRRFQCGLLVVVGLLRFTGVLVDVRVDTERTPGITRDEEVPEPGLPLELVFNPDPKVPELYFRFLFHNLPPVRDSNSRLPALGNANHYTNKNFSLIQCQSEHGKISILYSLNATLQPIAASLREKVSGIIRS